MKVLIVIDSMRGGGAERQAAILYRGLRRHHHVVLVALEDGNEYLTVGDDDDVHFLGKTSRYDGPRLVRELARLARGADVAICFNWYPQLVLRLAAPKVPRVVRYGGAVGLDVEGGVRVAIARWCQRSAAAVVALTSPLLETACRRLGSPTVLCSVVPNSIDPEMSHPGKSSGSPWPRRYIICAARLTSEKDQVTLVRALKLIEHQVPHDLILAGEGPDEAYLRDHVSESGLSARVHFIGFTPHLAQWFEWADLTVLTSRSEGFGSVLIESMAMGTPVVATDAPFGPREILQRIRGGVLVPVGDPESLAAAVHAMLTESASDIMKGQELADEAERLWGSESMVRSYMRILDAVVSGYRPETVRKDCGVRSREI